MFGCDKIKNREPVRCLAVALAALLTAGLLFLLRMKLQGDGAYAAVLLDGEETARYPLDEDGVYRIGTGNDGYNVLTIRAGTASVTESDCPNQVCVHTRAAQYEGETINCLPHRLQIRIVGGERTAYDAITD